MSATQAAEYMRALKGLKFNIANLFTQEIFIHNSIHLVNNIRACKDNLLEEDLVLMYFDAMPTTIKTTIGAETIQQCKSIADIHKKIELTLTLIPSSNRGYMANDPIVINTLTELRKDVDNMRLENTENMQALSKHYEKKKYTHTAPTTEQEVVKMNKRNVECWHCGVKGHNLHECPTYKKGIGQTVDGMKVYAQWLQKNKGEPMEYDADKIIQKRLERNKKFEKKNKRRILPSEDSEGSSSSTRTVNANAITEEVCMTTMTDGNIKELGSHQTVRELNKVENKYAHSLAMQQVTLNGVEVGLVLHDLGATRSLIRRSTSERIINTTKEVPLLSRTVLKSSSGHNIPMKDTIKIEVKVRGKSLGETIMYIVEDSAQADICCDIVFGKPFLSTCTHSLMDVKNNLLINSEDKNDVIQLIPAKLTQIELNNGRVISRLVALNSKEENDNLQVITDISDTSETTKIKDVNIKDMNEVKTIKVFKKELPMSSLDENKISKRADDTGTNKNNKNKKKTHEESINVDTTMNNTLIKTFDSYVDQETTYTDNMKNVIKDYVKENINCYTVANNNTNYEYMHQMFVDDSSHTREDEARLKNYLHAYAMTDKGSGEGKLLLDEIVNNKIDTMEPDNDEEEDEVMKEVDNIDYPLSAPQQVDNVVDLQKEKALEIHKIINGLKDWSQSQKDILIKEIMTYEHLYSLRGEGFKQTDVVQHEINTGDGLPFKQKWRTYSYPLQKIIDTEVNRMIKDGIIVKSKSSYASNLLLVRKEDPSSPGGIKNRVCVNFIQLNKQTIKDTYPLPNQLDIFNRVGASVVFTTMDLMSGYWQVMIKPEHRHKTAFVSSRGLYEFTVMAFGLCNAPGTFQRLMDDIVVPEYRDFIQTYIDDIITHSKTFEEHIGHLNILHKTLDKNKLTVKLSKCKFAQKEVKFLGHILTEGKVKPNPEKVNKIGRWLRPKDVTGLKSFLSSVGWYRRFIKHFAHIARPLYDLTKKTCSF